MYVGDIENMERGAATGIAGPSASVGNVGGAKRTALGVLSHNALSRVQPQRMAKKTQGATSFTFSSIDENLVPSKPAVGKRKESQTFTIHEEDGDRGQDVPDSRWIPAVATRTLAAPTERTALPASVVAMGVRQPLATLSVSISAEATLNVSMEECSPMVTDSSRSERSDSTTLDDLLVETYCKEIYDYLRKAEVHCRPKVGYMRKQPDITTSMRSILVDWLVEVVEEYKLHSETLYLAVNYIDRFLSSMSVLRGKLQLVGTAAMYLAASLVSNIEQWVLNFVHLMALLGVVSKYHEVVLAAHWKFEEIYPPEVGEFVFITDDTYTKKQVLRMESLILKVLSFAVASPTIMQFLTQYLKRGGACCRMKNLAMYVSELSLLEEDPYLQYLPSLLAAAAFTLANYTISGCLWPSILSEFTGYSLEDIRPCLVHLHKTYVGAATHAQQSIRDKYKTSKYEMVSLIEPPTNLPQA